MNRKSCVLCKHHKFNAISFSVRDTSKHNVIRCKTCGHVQLFPIPTFEEDRDFYNADQQAKNIGYKTNLLELRKKTFEDTQRRANLIEGIITKKGSILEIGSGYGFFLEEMKKRGFKVTGIEVSNERRKISEKITDVKISSINLNEEIDDIGNFDIIILFFVLEHIIDPVKFLQNIRKLVKPKGKIIIEVPNLDDFQLKLNVSYQKWFWQRAHIHYFSSKILKKILTSSGFTNTKIFGIQRYSIENMFNWKINNSPQILQPTYNLPREIEWIEKYYKSYLQENLTCDTLVAISSKR